MGPWGPDRAAPLDAVTQSELGDLAVHWGEAYDITCDPDTRTWTARHKGGGEPLTAETSEDLRYLIREDYRLRKVPRPEDGGTESP